MKENGHSLSSSSWVVGGGGGGGGVHLRYLIRKNLICEFDGNRTIYIVFTQFFKFLQYFDEILKNI